MTDQYLQGVNDRKIILQETLGEPLCEYIILQDKLKKMIESGAESTEQAPIRKQMREVIHFITQIIED